MAGWKPFAALIAICFLWGTTYLAIKIGMDDHFPPFLFSGLRFVISGIIILLFYLPRKEKMLPSKQDFKRMLISGIFIFMGGNLLLVLAEQSVPSGLAALVNTAFPLWIVIITRLWNPGEKTPRMVLAGILIGLLGQWLIFYDHIFLLGNTVYTGGLLLLIWGVINGALGSVHMKKYPIHSNPVLTGGWQMLVCGSITTVIGIYLEEWPQLPGEMSGWWSMIYLIVAGSVLGYSLFVYALRYLPAQQVSVYAYINPIVAVFLGWLLLHETINEKSILAMGITITGVFLVNRGMQRS
jgi:drug/metabolite transporter (DMT)-like permease